MQLTQKEFTSAWGADALVHSSTASVPVAIPGDACTFLVQAGLPALIKYFGGSTESLITFCRLATGPSPLLAEPTVGPPLPREWSVYWVLDDEFFCNGAAWWCLYEQTGHIDRIDIELEQPVKFVNSSVPHIAAAILAAYTWSRQTVRSPEEWPSTVDRFKQELAMIDRPSMESSRNFWPSYLNFISDEGPHLLVFEKGFRSEGERTLQAGPW